MCFLVPLLQADGLGLHHKEGLFGFKVTVIMKLPLNYENNRLHLDFPM